MGRRCNGYGAGDGERWAAVDGDDFFLDGATNICTIAVAPSASCPASAGADFAVGTHVLTAVYSGDATHLGSTSAPVTVTVVAGGDADEGADGDDADLESGSGDEWTERDVYRECGGGAGSIAVPTGVVTFLDGSTVLGTKTLVGSGVASFSTSSLSVGSHAITASYAGDANSVASVSAVLTETVNGT